MPLPQVSTRLKEIPAQALRAVFAGIGQMLLIVDKVRARAVEQMSGPAPASRPLDQAADATSQAPAPAAPPAAAPPPEPAESIPDGPRFRSLDETGNVRLLNQDGQDVEPDEEGLEPGASIPPVAVAEPAEAAPPAASEPPAAPEPAPVPEPPVTADAAAAPAMAAPEAATLPVPNYDQATVASLRARLRVLDSAQIRVLLDYEQAHESRAAVISMFERRLAKLEGSG